MITSASRVLAVVPVRSGSKGVPNKNIAEVGGKTLLELAIKKILEASFVDRLVVSTDSELYAELAVRAGASVPFLRPQTLSEDTVRLHHVLKHALTYHDEVGSKFDAVLSVQVTAPFLRLESLENMYSLGVSSKAESVATAAEISRQHPYLAFSMAEDGAQIEYLLDLGCNGQRYPRQIRPKLFFFSGCAFLRSRCLLDNLDEQSNCLGSNPVPLILGEVESLNIDSKTDLCLANALANQGFSVE